MKLMAFVFINIVSVVAACAASAFDGQWRYMDSPAGGGQMDIRDCGANTCHISFSTSNGAHTCDLDEATLYINKDMAYVDINDEFTENCHIEIRKKYDDVIDVTANDGCASLCGMNGYFTGRWELDERPITYPAGFDCDLAKTESEIAICRNKELAEMDAEISTLYKKAKNQKSKQKEWLAQRNKCAGDTKCLSAAYNARIRELVTNVSGQEFSLYNYARLVSNDGYFHPKHAVLIERVIREKIGDNNYDDFVICSSRYSTNTASSDFIFNSYGCAGMFTFYESASYIDPNQIWIAYIGYTDSKTNPLRKIIVYGPRDAKISDMPASVSDWVNDLQKRIRSDNEGEIIFKNKL